jgi:hypothetical protein
MYEIARMTDKHTHCSAHTISVTSNYQGFCGPVHSLTSVRVIGSIFLDQVKKPGEKLLYVKYLT